MLVSRRKFMEVAAAGIVSLPMASKLANVAEEGEEVNMPLRIGMCDWSLGKMGDIDAIRLARTMGLNGVEVSIHFPAPGQHLRDPKVQGQYRNAIKRYGIMIPSVALAVLNDVPLKSEPKTAIWLADAIEVARKLGAAVILIALFGSGELKMEKADEIGRVVDVLKELAPRAERAGVILGLENTLSAEDNLKILGRVGHKAVQVYYDLKNSADQGRNVPAEIRMLGDRICQVHLKNANLLLSQPGNVDFPACAEALREIGYQGWYVLETASPYDLLADTRANIEYVRKTFDIR